MKRRNMIVMLFAVLTLSTQADAQHRILFKRSVTAETFPRQQTPLGLEIGSDTWSDTSSEYSDATYRAFRMYQTSQKKNMSEDDYYYRLKLVTPSNFTSTDSDCSPSPFLQALAGALFGAGKASLIMVNTTISYEPAIGAVTPLISSEKTPMLMFSQGASPGVLGPGRNCFLKETTAVEFPVIRFENGDPNNGKEVFHVNFDVLAGRQLQSNFLSNALGLFSSASTAFSWNAITAGQAGFIQKGAQAFDTALASAGNLEFEQPVNPDPLRQRQMMYLSLPGGFRQRHLVEIFPYLSGSIILTPHRNLSPATVLNNNDFAFRSCTLTGIVAGTCAPKPARISIVTSDYFKQDLPKDYQLPLTVFDPAGKPELVYVLCNDLRRSLDDLWRLSTLDQILVRWALTKESGLQVALADATKLKSLLAATQKNHPNVDATELQRACWNAGDTKVLNDVTTNPIVNVQLNDDL